MISFEKINPKVYEAYNNGLRISCCFKPQTSQIDRIVDIIDNFKKYESEATSKIYTSCYKEDLEEDNGLGKVSLHIGDEEIKSFYLWFELNSNDSRYVGVLYKNQKFESIYYDKK